MEWIVQDANRGTLTGENSVFHPFLSLWLIFTESVQDWMHNIEIFWAYPFTEARETLGKLELMV
jgi:hypothetical protein